jgi:tetratricopeptide (TPR) repeat protein
MGERFLFQPSLGFAIVVGYGFHRFTSPNGIMPASLGNALAGGALLLLVVLSGLKTIARNRDWRDDLSLFSKDVHAAPNSAKTHNHLAIALLKTLPAADNEEEKTKMLHEALSQSKQAVAIYPSYADAFVGMGLAYSLLGELEDAAKSYETVKLIRPSGTKVLQANLLNLSNLYLNRGLKEVANDTGKAKTSFEKAIHFNPSNSEALYNMGGVFFMTGDIAKAREYWNQALLANPSHHGAEKWLQDTGHE